jgi:hypothetical protein
MHNPGVVLSIPLMTQAEIDALLRMAVIQCEVQGCPLTAQQRQILAQIAASLLDEETPLGNPLDALSDSQRQALLQFVVAQEAQGRSWRATLLNDWLQGQDSGLVQFIRDDYGPQWLNRITDEQINQALNRTNADRVLQVGDRIEVSNRLWEWVQEGTPCDETWFPCTVVRLSAPEDGIAAVVRFDNGMEYEIQGMMEWNRYSWRWAEG